MKIRWPATVTLTVPIVAVDEAPGAAGTAALALVGGSGGGNRGAVIATDGGTASTVALGAELGIVASPIPRTSWGSCARRHTRLIATINAATAVHATSTRGPETWRLGEAGTRGSSGTTARSVAPATGGG
jgi:hypothetical protein